MSIKGTFKALSDPIRQRILELLKSSELIVTQLANELGLTNAALSYHLRVLKKADLIYERKDKNFIYYQLNEKQTKDSKLIIDETKASLIDTVDFLKSTDIKLKDFKKFSLI
jgi:DNA-binding transcriptional ArsR family regulator